MLRTRSIQVSDDQWGAVEDAAWRERMSMSEWVRGAIADKLKAPAAKKKATR